MTLITELERWLAELEAAHAETRRAVGTSYDMALHRLRLGVPNDADLEEIIAHGNDVVFMYLGISAVSDHQDRDCQLRDHPSFVLAADLTAAREPVQVRLALTALRQLATTGHYESPKGRQRARPDQVGLARLLLRILVRDLRAQGAPGASTSITPDTT